jgi:hypothetical protein
MTRIPPKVMCLCLMLHGVDMVPLFRNSLRSLRAHCPDLDVVLFVSETSATAYVDLCRQFGVDLRVFAAHASSGAQGYANYGTGEFNYVMRYKFLAIRTLLGEGYKQVVFADVDIAYLGDFRSHLLRAAALYGLGVQSSCQPYFPNSCCLGFMYFTQRSASMAADLEAMVIRDAATGNDEDLFNREMNRNKALVRETYVMPESLFVTGNGYMLLRDDAPFDTVSKAKPFMFHANYVVGLERKVALLRHVGLWQD